ncbi:MAG: CDP-glucose 4,6-dehydratase [Clostridiales bacterium]
MLDMNFYKDKKVLVTGHTGFKGTWLCKMLINSGAKVTGYALEPPTNPSVFQLSGISAEMNSVIGDIRDLEKLMAVFGEVQPEIVFHLAAQPIVRDSYKRPVYTYETNVMGTVNILECIRLHECVKSFLNVTTDKVYRNNEGLWGYRENEFLDGFDPYSNSKSCSELVTHSYYNSFFADRPVAISTARAGNVIGGGDFATDRIIPDCVRAAKAGETIIVRNPNSVRPYQHVLEPLFVYLMIAEKQWEYRGFADSYNVGPDDCDCVTTGTLVSLFCEKWGKNQRWKDISEDNAPHEANFLKLDCSKIKSIFSWHPRWGIEIALEKVCQWTKVYFDGGNISEIMDQQINEFLSEEK